MEELHFISHHNHSQWCKEHQGFVRRFGRPRNPFSGRVTFVLDRGQSAVEGTLSIEMIDDAPYIAGYLKSRFESTIPESVIAEKLKALRAEICQPFARFGETNP